MRDSEYTDGRTARSFRAILDWREDYLSIRTDTGAELDRWRYDEVRRFPGWGKSGYELGAGFEDGTRLRVANPKEMLRFRQYCRNLNSRKPKEKGWWKGYFYWTSGAVVSLVLLFLIVIPALVKHAKIWMPYSWEEKIGAYAVDAFVGFVAVIEEKPESEIICGIPEGVAALEKMVLPVSVRDEAARLVKVHVIDSRMVNALAFPGGQVLITSGLLDLVSDPLEMANLLGHVTKRGQVEGYARNISVAGLLRMMTRESANNSAGLVTGEAILPGNADKAGRQIDLAFLGGAQFGHESLAEVMDELGVRAYDVGFSVDNWLYEHPVHAGSKRRIDSDLIGESEMFNSLDWRALKNICP